MSAIAHLDAVASLAAAAATPGWVRPQFDSLEAPSRLVVRGGRHPTLDASLPGGAVPNDVDLNASGACAAIVTGGPGPWRAGLACLGGRLAPRTPPPCSDP